MLYAILKPVMKAALRLYFGRIVTNGLEQIDNGRPTLVLANHTASFMDALITACFVKRRIHFFTRGDVFRHPVANKLMRSLGMLPVYRFSDGKDKLQLNDSSNEEALRILGRGGAVLIFAEGASDVAKVLKPLKKGPFRLAVTAAATLAEPPLIVAMGINYIRPADPFGDAFLLAAAPVPAPEPEGADEAAAAKTATGLMRRTAGLLQPLVWDVRSADGLPVAEGMLELLGQVKPDYSFADSQRLLDQLERDQFLPGNIATEAAKKARVSAGPLRYAALALSAPFALAGFLGHHPPVKLAQVITDARVREADFRAPVFLSLAIVLGFIWYFILLIAFLLAGWGWVSVAILLLLAGCGIFYLKWYRPALISAGITSHGAPDTEAEQEQIGKQYILNALHMS